jgi:hypothetical protein
MVTSLQGHEPGRRGMSAIGSNVTENTGLCVVVSCEIDTSQRGRKLRSACQAVPSEDIEDSVHAVVICCVCMQICESVIVNCSYEL